MKLPRLTILAATLIALASPGSAQTLPPAEGTGALSAGQSPGPERATWLEPDSFDLSPRAEAPNPFKALGGDLKRFLGPDNLRFMGIASVFAIAAAPWDDEGIERAQEHWAPAPSVFKAGNIGGSFLVQAGAGIATYAVGKAAGDHRAAVVGGDLFRAQVVSQIVVQGIKFGTKRERPDGSNDHSFPSGHTSSAFATATVLERHFGWKVGIPAYTFAAYVGASRMSANKHHLSDVIMGAALGVAAGRVVTIGIGDAKFGMGVAPTRGGAAVMFTRK